MQQREQDPGSPEEPPPPGVAAGKTYLCEASPIESVWKKAKSRLQSHPNNYILVPYEPLTLEQAKQRRQRGEHVLQVPFQLNTNVTFQAGVSFQEAFPGQVVSEIKKTILLYSSLSDVSRDVCEVDLAKLVEGFLDYQVKKFVKDNLAACSNLFGNGSVFLDTRAQHVQYVSVMEYLERNKYVGAPNTQERCSWCKIIMDHAESQVASMSDQSSSMEDDLHWRLSNVRNVRSCDVEVVKHQLHNQMAAFYRSTARKDRITASHMFSELLYKDMNSILSSCHLSDELPPVRSKHFNMEDAKVRFQMGVRVLIAQDLLSLYERDLLRTSSELRWIHYVALRILGSLFSMHTTKSLDYRYEDLRAQLHSWRSSDNMEICNLKELKLQLEAAEAQSGGTLPRDEVDNLHATNVVFMPHG